MSAASAAAADVPRGWRVDRQYRLPIVLLLAASFAFPLLPVGLVFDPVARESLTSTTVSGTFRAMWMPLIAIGAWILVRRRTLMLSMLPELNWSLLLLYAWVLTTTLWAPDPGATLRQCIGMLGAWVIAFAEIAASWQPERWIRVVRRTAVAMLVLSTLSAVLVPAVGVEPGSQFELAGSWRGITYQKNGLGQLASFGLILCLYTALTRPWRRGWAWAGGALAFLNVLMSRSSTATLLALISVLLLYVQLRPLLRTRPQERSILRYGLGLLVMVPLLLWLIIVGGFDSESFAQSFGGLFGKDATLSGRTYIWAELLKEIPKHLWQGIGFNSFWLAGTDGPAADAIRRLQWDVPNGHNAYLDMANEIGLIGVGLFLCFLVEHVRAIGRLRRIDPQQAALHLTLLVYILVANLTEVGWFHPIMVTHMVAMFSSANISRLLFEQRLTMARLSPSSPPHRPRAGWAAGTASGSAARP